MPRARARLSYTEPVTTTHEPGYNMKVHHIIVPLSHGYMEYVETDAVYSAEAGGMIHPSHYSRTVDYSQVVDACIEDLKESRYL